MDDRTDRSDRTKDALATAVGVGVLGFQRLQIGRRQVKESVRDAARRLDLVARDLDAQVDPVLDRVEARLPAGVDALARRARALAVEGRNQVLGRLAGEGASLDEPDEPDGPPPRTRP